MGWECDCEDWGLVREGEETKGIGDISGTSGSTNIFPNTKCYWTWTYYSLMEPKNKTQTIGAVVP